MLVSDIEYILVFLLMLIGIVGGVKKRATLIDATSLSLLAIDKKWTDVIKGIACVFVLMGHYGQRMFDYDMPLGVSKLVWFTTANIALCWFMFFSGYGLSLKDYSKAKIGSEWWKRAMKIYLPLLLVCVCSMLVYAILPDYGLENKWNMFTPYIHMLHSFDPSFLPQVLRGTFGLFDWYVSCILIFYTIFYVSVYLSRKINVNHTILLAIFMLAYNVVAYFVFGWGSAHYFRYPWIFMLGHVVATYKKNNRLLNIGVLVIFAISTLIHDKIQLCCFASSIIGILVFSYLSRKYEFSGRVMLTLGSISYFFYLSHVRIGYTLLAYLEVHSVFVWILISVAVAILLKKIYAAIGAYLFN